MSYICTSDSPALPSPACAACGLLLRPFGGGDWARVGAGPSLAGTLLTFSHCPLLLQVDALGDGLLQPLARLADPLAPLGGHDALAQLVDLGAQVLAGLAHVLTREGGLEALDAAQAAALSTAGGRGIRLLHNHVLLIRVRRQLELVGLHFGPALDLGRLRPLHLLVALRNKEKMKMKKVNRLI